MIDYNNSDIINCLIGQNVKIIKPVNMYGCTIGDNSFVGPFCEIQKNVIIGNNVKVQSHTFICELVTIKDNCFIGHGVMFTNDKFLNGKISFKSDDWLTTEIQDNVLIGSNSTILPVKICKNVVIGAGSVVTKDITKPGTYAGNPAKFLKE